MRLGDTCLPTYEMPSKLSYAAVNHQPLLVYLSGVSMRKKTIHPWQNQHISVDSLKGIHTTVSNS